MRYADRMNHVQKSFIREILKVTVDPDVISFAGGLPNPVSFPIEEIEIATRQVLTADGSNALQYSTTEGYLPLRELIADRYAEKKGISIHPDEILITNGSQQGLDLLGKVFLDKGDGVIIEKPGYLGAIQALSMFEPRFHVVDLLDDGIDIGMLEENINKYQPKLFYTVPNFQNPSGITYAAHTRERVGRVLGGSDTVLIEDDPYGELRFMGEDMPSMKTYLNDNIVLLGSFSKIISPSMRLGWMCANRDMMDKLIVAKQAADLHTNYFAQRVIHRYLADHDIDSHIEKIRQLYRKQRNCMVDMIEKYFPQDIKCTRPQGGMFLWVTLPDGFSSQKLFGIASKENVAFVPGDPFYVDGDNMNTLRLNYTNSSEEKIREGIKRLSKAIHVLMDE